MNVKKAYNQWAAQYDSNDNKTRDLEAHALRSLLADFNFKNCLEIGCGTGKNTPWLISKSDKLTALDFSEEMLAKAKEKIKSTRIEFVQADVTEDWDFAKEPYDLVTFSLVLEHIENLNAVFQKVQKVTTPKALIYVGELHPFKQYSGSKARFDTATGTEVLTCFDHHISDFTQAAKNNGFEVLVLKEFFDADNREGLPRILGLLFLGR